MTAQDFDIVGNLAVVRQQIARAAAIASRDPNEITLIAVSKGQPAAAIRQAFAAGQRDFGENYVQEWQQKAQELQDLPALRWHFIGHLQRNKVKNVIGKVHLLHTADDMQGMDEMARFAHSQHVAQDVLLQVSLAGEAQKRGCTADDVEIFAEVLLRSPGLRLQGLMTVPPVAEGSEANRNCFAQLRRLSEQLQRAVGAHPQAPKRWLLSMGMSADFGVAIEEGATHVRVGTAIFGAR